MERLEVEKAFHPFIAGPYNRLVSEIMQETGTRINIPPPSVSRTEIVFTGEKEQLAQAVARVKKIYEEKVAAGEGEPPALAMARPFSDASSASVAPVPRGDPLLCSPALRAEGTLPTADQASEGAGSFRQWALGSETGSFIWGEDVACLFLPSCDG